jgi:hypothetical protein
MTSSQYESINLLKIAKFSRFPVQDTVYTLTAVKYVPKFQCWPNLISKLALQSAPPPRLMSTNTHHSLDDERAC